MRPIPPFHLCDNVHCMFLVDGQPYGSMFWAQCPGGYAQDLGRQRIKRARSAREDSSMYLYITGVPFPRSKCRKHHIPQGVPRVKCVLCGLHPSAASSSCLELTHEVVLGVPWRHFFSDYGLPR